MRKILAFGAATAFSLLIAGPTYAGVNGNPVFPAPPVGGGTSFGIAILGGAYQADGTIIRGVGATSNASKLGTGQYQVNLNKIIASGCLWTGSIGFGTFGGNSGPGQIQVTGRSGSSSQLFVETYDSSGTLVDLPFEVVVVCG
jgi:hypothetical protein